MSLRAGLLTSIGEGGISVIAVVGEGAADLVSPRLRAANGTPKTPEPGRLAYAFLCDAGGERLDEVIVACENERRVEINCHGGIIPARRILESLAAEGATIVSGEETLALAAEGDMVSREAAAALRAASTDLAARVFAAQLGGALGDAVCQAMAALSEAQFDSVRATAILEELVDSAAVGLALANPPIVAVVGPVNAGKSTLVNALAGFERAIVSSVPGATRDALEVPVSLFGVPVTLVDTAGAKAAGSTLDAAAAERARRALETCSAAVVVIDASAPLPDGLEAPARASRTVVAANKSDLEANDATVAAAAAWGAPIVTMSALTGGGIDELSRAILGVLGVPVPDRNLATRAVIFTHRQLDCVSEALRGIQGGDAAVARAALQALCGGRGAGEDYLTTETQRHRDTETHRENRKVLC